MSLLVTLDYCNYFTRQLLVSAALLWILDTASGSGSVDLEPTFDVPIVNVTVVRGQIALLPCSIDFLGKYKVAWLDEASIPLTYDERRIVDDTRFTVIRPGVREWNLQIRDVTWHDQGQYRCTVNTLPVRSKVVMLHVKVPASIASESSSGDVIVKERDTMVLTCNATGIPRPEVTWYRRSSLAVKHGRRAPRTRISKEPSETLIIRNVSRYSDDLYECVASNGVPPAAVRRIRVTVEFAPEIYLPNRRIGQWRRRETILECVITAFPQAVNYWEKDGRRLTSTTSSKHRVEVYDESQHRLTLSLRVHVTDDDDFGEYTCVASNSLGKVQKVMYLYGANQVFAFGTASGITKAHLVGSFESLTEGVMRVFRLIVSHPWVDNGCQPDRRQCQTAELAADTRDMIQSRSSAYKPTKQTSHNDSTAANGYKRAGRIQFVSAKSHELPAENTATAAAAMKTSTCVLMTFCLLSVFKSTITVHVPRRVFDIAN